MAISDNDEDEDAWLAAAAEAAGFDTTPPAQYVFDPQLDSASLRACLEDLASLHHESAASNAASTDAVADLTQPFDIDATLLRAYDESPCQTLVITFGGLTQGFPGQPTPGCAQYEFVGALRRIGVAHALFVRDPMQSWYLRRLRGDNEAADPFASVVALLRRELAFLRPARVVTIGASMGGYAAIRAAVMLNAHLAVAFGPQVFLHPDERRHLKLPWQVMDSPLEGLHRDAAAVGIHHLERQSLATLLSDHVAAGGGRRAGGVAAGAAPTALAAPAVAGAATVVKPAASATLASAAPTPKALPSEIAQTRIAMHVGGRSDLLEARLLQEAVSRGASSLSGASGVAGSVEVHHHQRHGHNLAFQMRAEGFLEPLLRAHLAPLGCMRQTPSGERQTSGELEGTVGSVTSVVASDNRGDVAPEVAGSRRAATREERFELVRRANAGHSNWLARAEVQVGAASVALPLQP